MRLIHPLPILIVTCAALCPGPALGQDAPDTAVVTVEGEVLDAANNVPVAVAIVAIPALNRSAITDELGYFRFEGVTAGSYPIQVHRLGYDPLEAEVPLNGQEVLALYLTPGPVSLEGIEVRVMSDADVERRAMGISTRSIIGPLEMEELRERYFSLDQILLGRHFPRARFRPGRGLGDPGCLVASDAVPQRTQLRGGGGRRGAPRPRGEGLGLPDEHPRHLLGAIPLRSRRRPALRPQGRRWSADDRDAGGPLKCKVNITICNVNHTFRTIRRC